MPWFHLRSLRLHQPNGSHLPNTLLPVPESQKHVKRFPKKSVEGRLGILELVCLARSRHPQALRIWQGTSGITERKEWE